MVPRVVGDLVEPVLGDPELGGDLLHQPAEFERDHAIGGREARDLLLTEQRHGRLVRGAVGDLPGAPDHLGAEESFDAGGGRVAERSGHQAGEGAQVVGHPTGQLVADVDALVDLVDEVGGERAADLVVGEQLRRRLDPLVGVEELALDPGVDRREHTDDRRDDDQQRDQHPPIGRPGRLGGGWGVGCVRRIVLHAAGLYSTAFRAGRADEPPARRPEALGRLARL